MRVPARVYTDERTIGGVAAVDAKEEVISPGGIGYDINCGVRLLRSDARLDDGGTLTSAFVRARKPA